MLDIAADYEALIQFLYLAPVGLTQISPDGEIAMINPISAQLLMPLSPDGDLTNLFTVLERVAPDLRHLTERFDRPHGQICDAMRLQVSAGVRGKSDPQILSLSLLKLDEGRLMAVLADISLQVKRERMLRQNEAWFNAILTGISDYALVSLDGQGRIDDWNPSIERVTGFTSEAALGQPYSIFYPEGATSSDRVLDRLREAEQNGWSLDDGWRMKADGTRFWGSAMIAPLRNYKDSPPPCAAAGAGPEDSAFCLVIRDITEKREASEQHRIATSCDHLTGIANRRTFFEAAELELDRAKHTPRPLSIVVFDADHFKAVNDTHGHPAGDQILRHLAERLTETFRQLDVVARVGGEEFAVLLPSTGLLGAQTVANRAREAIAAAPVVVDGVTIHYTVSGGVATMEDGVSGLDALMKRADEALYRAKASGRNCIVSWSQE
ncbi:MAG: diguanylate cyclase [Deltaproteobacteria bacterium]|nr:diguanylate cyclase [Nannocystaceae bacterium]